MTVEGPDERRLSSERRHAAYLQAAYPWWKRRFLPGPLGMFGLGAVLGAAAGLAVGLLVDHRDLAMVAVVACGGSFGGGMISSSLPVLRHPVYGRLLLNLSSIVAVALVVGFKLLGWLPVIWLPFIPRNRFGLMILLGAVLSLVLFGIGGLSGLAVGMSGLRRSSKEG